MPFEPQEVVDAIYSRLCSSITSEMDKFLLPPNGSTLTRKCYRLRHAFWNQELHAE